MRLRTPTTAFFFVVVITLLSGPLVSGLEECKGVTTSEFIPCNIFLPSPNGCSSVTVSFYQDASFLDQRGMGTYTPFLCNATFNYSDAGTYVFNYSSGDTGSIIVEEDSMLNIFNLMVYAAMTGLGLIFVLFMHIFKEDAGTPVVYGALGSAVFAIVGAMLLSGFQLVRNVTFFFDINYYLVGLAFILSLYSGVVAYNFWKPYKSRDVGPYG